ncbi:MAG: hypothetical protein DCC57_13935 [Chloroflexi bacterium]|nr:MAG: hypothetical protein DCC57_13935 [Chloroflexota bacterium]
MSRGRARPRHDPRRSRRNRPSGGAADGGAHSAGHRAVAARRAPRLRLLAGWPACPAFSNSCLIPRPRFADWRAAD